MCSWCALGRYEGERHTEGAPGAVVALFQFRAQHLGADAQFRRETLEGGDWRRLCRRRRLLHRARVDRALSVELPSPRPRRRHKPRAACLRVDHEGIVSKRLGSAYSSGVCHVWVKVKNPDAVGKQRERAARWNR